MTSDWNKHIFSKTSEKTEWWNIFLTWLRFLCMFFHQSNPSILGLLWGWRSRSIYPWVEQKFGLSGFHRWCRLTDEYFPVTNWSKCTKWRKAVKRFTIWFTHLSLLMANLNVHVLIKMTKVLRISMKFLLLVFRNQIKYEKRPNWKDGLENLIVFDISLHAFANAEMNFNCDWHEQKITALRTFLPSAQRSSALQIEWKSTHLNIVTFIIKKLNR